MRKNLVHGVNVGMDVFYGTDALIHHMQKIQCLRYHNRLEDNNVNRMTQSITDENISTNSHHDNINR